MIKVAITGGLSCGKSSVCRFFQEMGAYVVSADDLIHQLLTPLHPLGYEVIKLLGSDIVVDGRLDRSLVAQKVFGNSYLLKQLEGLLHPAVREVIEEHYQRAMKQSPPPLLFAAEIPLLFETGSHQFYDASIAVIADEKLCRQRFFEKTGYGVEEFDKRMSRQLSQQDKADRADYIIVNNGDILQLKQAAKSLYEQLVA